MMVNGWAVLGGGGGIRGWDCTYLPRSSSSTYDLSDISSGLVAISASCATCDTEAAVVIGIIG